MFVFSNIDLKVEQSIVWITETSLVWHTMNLRSTNRTGPASTGSILAKSRNPAKGRSSVVFRPVVDSEFS